MKQVCTLCGRTAVDGTLWCQEVDCPIGQMPVMLNYGEPFGDLEIVKPLTVLRASAIYAAVRNGEPVLLKVAHDGHHNRLKREAEWLMQSQLAKQTISLLPTLLPAHRNTDYAYGKTIYQGRMRYYCLFEHCDGDFLRELLLKNPQPWYQHAGWITVSIAQAVEFLHRRGVLHLALSPEAVLVRFEQDKQGLIPRVKLLDLGAVSSQQDVGQSWHPGFALTAYTAPELLGEKRPFASQATDVYGTGLIFYEMLAGHPAYEFRLRTENAIKQDVLANRKQPLNRTDLTKLPELAQQATHLIPNQRLQNLSQFLQALYPLLPPLPKENTTQPWYQHRAVPIVLSVLFVIGLLITIVLLATDATTF